jgi:alpha-amylase
MPHPYAATSLALVTAVLLGACSGAPPAAPPAASPSSPPANVAPWDHDWARGAVFYEVFVRSFADSNGDGVGDLQGLISKLDYLNDGDPATDRDLGVDALWLMPVFESPSYHGYDTVDYETIDREYGTNADFERLLAEAHKRGVRIIVDFVMNHSSSQHPWFVESASSPSSPRRDWYVWRADDPGWKQPWGGTNSVWHEKNGAYYYGVFWGGMPDLNFATPAVRQEMKRLAGLWISRGVDGFRLDATRHLFANGPYDLQNDQPETHVYLEEFGRHVRSVNPKAVLVGENWTTTPAIAQYFRDLPMNFNFPLGEAIIQGVGTSEASGIAAKLSEMAELYPPDAIDAPFLTNHDMIRVATQLRNHPGALRSASAILLTLPGAPFLYYGEELGLQNGGTAREDELKRTPMPWSDTPGGGFTTGNPWHRFSPGRETANVAVQTGDPASLLSHYRRLIRVRKASPALQKGTLRLLSPENRATPVLSFLRESEGDRILVVHNLGGVEADAGPYAIEGTSLEPLLVPAGTAPVQGAGGWTVRLPAWGSGIWRVR